jgi:hypothetical protein
MPLGLGFFATAGAGAQVGAFDLLETQILGSPAASVTFSNVGTNYGATYQHLQIRYTGTYTTYGGFYMYLNGDGNSNGNYYNHSMYSTGGGLGNGAQADAQISYQWDAGINGTVIDLLDAFESTKFKNSRIMSGNTINGSGTNYYSSQFWKNTAAITSIQIFNVRQNIPTGARFSLYGIKAA